MARYPCFFFCQHSNYGAPKAIENKAPEKIGEAALIFRNTKLEAPEKISAGSLQWNSEKHGKSAKNYPCIVALIFSSGKSFLERFSQIFLAQSNSPKKIYEKRSKKDLPLPNSLQIYHKAPLLCQIVQLWRC